VASPSEAGQYELELMNWAARIGSQAKLDGIAKSQIEQLIGSAELIPEHAPLITAAFAHRQAERLKKGHNTARVISQAMKWLYQEKRDKNEVRKLLGLAKWVFECVENQYIREQFKTFEDLVKSLAEEKRR
jgi:hypothetical protein